MSVFVYWRCQAAECRRVFRNRRFEDGIRPRCPYCGTDEPPKEFRGDPQRHLPPCSPGLRLRSDVRGTE